jgi:hypothetical protein
MIERLQAFRRRSKVLPKRIIVFRDGVSEVRLCLSNAERAITN